jgi:hypothetical protein
MHGTSVEILKSKELALQEGDEAMMHQIGRGRDIISLLSMHNLNVSVFVHSLFRAASEGEHASIRRRQGASVRNPCTCEVSPFRSNTVSLILHVFPDR